MEERQKQIHTQICQLVENYYDIQKIRVESFNRIVSWIKENDQKVRDIIEKSQTSNETHRNIASHSTYETHSDIASQKSNENQEKIAEDIDDDALYQVSFQALLDNSTENIENRKDMKGDLSQLLDNKKYSIIAKKVCGDILNIPDIDDTIWFHNKSLETEKELGKRLDEWSHDAHIRKIFLGHVKGIGGVFSSGLIAWLGPISRFDNISKMWSYCGLSPESKRKKGEKLTYNPRLKTFCWKIWNSFIKYDCVGRKLYLTSKKYCEEQHTDWTKLHIHLWAGRRTVKIFLACLWLKWREIEGLPTTNPYSIDILKHSDYVKPEIWIEKD